MIFFTLKCCGTKHDLNVYSDNFLNQTEMQKKEKNLTKLHHYSIQYAYMHILSLLVFTGILYN